MENPDYYIDSPPMSDYDHFLDRYDVLRGELLRHRASQRSQAARGMARARTFDAPTLSPDSLESPESPPRRYRTFHATFSTKSSNSSLDTVVEDAECEEMAEAQRLTELAEDIKLVLMELLNCNEVRRDIALRKWVQSRLMETEQELRSGRGGRRRRIAAAEWLE